ncbi:hypothetical protein [Amycolatopsis anabasis]|uniref:hypothetical protein n=1 Tax=Amycolatopsis anabasis TaxID=1840409 RepID=UPI00131BA502|nr:hypothetical protein [Amycolatopsis anabasis]
MTSNDHKQLLGVYLNDHLAGAVAGSELANRLAGAERGADGATLNRIADEIAEDRRALLEIMAALEVDARRYKVIGAWWLEKIARLKPNRRLFQRSPLSRLLELEALRLGVEGKALGWRTLRNLIENADVVVADRLDRARVTELIARADRQADELEDLRLRATLAFLESGTKT